MSIVSLYEDYIFNPTTNNAYATNFWNIIPRKMNDIGHILQRNFQESDNFDENVLSELKNIIIKTHKSFGVLNSEINELLNNWDVKHRTIEIGHQPLYMGGGSFILNKLSFALGLNNFLNTNQTLKHNTIFFIGDHDQVQNELTVTRFPQFQSASGLELKTEYDNIYQTTPIAHMPIPEERDLLSQFQKIRINYKELFKFTKIKGHSRSLLEERLEQALNLLYDCYLSSNTYSDWIGKFWAKLFIIYNKSPLFILKSTDEQLQKLMLPHFEHLLVEENRIDFINILNENYYKIEAEGYKPGIPIREKNSVPFFYVCLECTGKNRVKLITTGNTLEGYCPSCKEKIIIDYNAKNPDFSDIYRNLSPRVETRAIIVNKLLNSVIRVTGGGETAYHAQLIPYFKFKKQNPPLILKNPRIYYNTPWSEKIASEINFDELIPLQNPDMFKNMSIISKSTDFESLKNIILVNKEIINTKLKKFEEKESNYREILTNKNDKEVKRKLDLVQLYLSHSFGKYQPDKSIQEVSWNWLDLGVLTGLNDIVGFYNRRLKPETPIASTYWLSLGQYN